MIELRQLTKRFARHTAVDALSLTVRPGEVLGFLGPNGAGKSTTLRVLLGLARADAGTVRVLGADPWTDAVDLHRQLAYVPGDVTLWPTLTGGETIDLLARMRGGLDTKRRDELIERFSLDPTKKARTYSKGNRQKVSLVSAFSSHARLLLLDEPSTGLDPAARIDLWRVLGDVSRRDGVTVLLTTHLMEEADRCDRLGVMAGGKLLAADTPDALKSRIGGDVITLTGPDPAFHRSKMMDGADQDRPWPQV